MMRKNYLAVLAVIIGWCFAASVSAAVFQYHLPVEYSRAETAKDGTSRTVKQQSEAFLWIPADAAHIRGVIMAGMTVMEREFVKDEQIRKACADQQIAIIFLKCGLSGPDLQEVLDQCASVSGYREISVAPLMFVGHSAGGPQAHDAAVKYSDRCFGLVQYRGGGPFNGTPIADGTPTLMMVGQFDEHGGTMRDADGREHAWQNAIDPLRKFRSEDEARLGSIVVEAGAGHFPWTDRNAKYLALFIQTAARERIPAQWPPDAAKPVDLVKIDYKTGWLTDMDVAHPKFKAAAYDQYEGDKKTANWHMTQELAEANVAYHAGAFGKKDQFIKWTDQYWVDAGVRYFFQKITWVGDGQTFQVHPVYADVYPSEPGGPRWADAGKPAGHSDGPILVRMVSGPIVAVGKDTLRMQFDNLAPATGGVNATFLAYNAGDDVYRYTERVGMLPRGYNGLNDGKGQTITFPALGNMKPDSAPVELKATSDSGLKVEYYVGYGPGVVEDGKLKITELPKGAKFPIELQVTAYQFGSGIAPQFKTAKPVIVTLQIEKP